MLKYILLASSMMIAVPAFAQETTTVPDTSTTQQTPPPDTPVPVQDPSAQPAPAEPQTPPPAPVDPAEGQQQNQTAQQPAPAPAPQPAETAQQPAPAQPAPAAQQPATSQSQVAAVVSTEFGTYDKDANGALDATEFASWMTALRVAAEPSFQPQSAEATTWFGQAFAQADADKNQTVSQAELTIFLTPKAS